jgi:ABC-type polysaccharide/polyol phosphate transport system ATPase subunit
VIEVESVSKTFHIPDQKIQTFKERAVHPFQRQHFRELEALRNISFEVRKGEFFGIVGRNGSGKSTLLKILASIYAADSGTIRMAGSLAPFIELGVGFNADVSAEENVILNGVMMGLTPDQARERIDAVFDFAELHDFREMRLKNYSSGMTVRLAFAVMIQADTDILLIDEVLAVGDAAFAQKCADVFHDMRESGKTIVLVTHDMSAVETFCDRAMMIHDGDLIAEGEPEEVARSYYRINFEEAPDDPQAIQMSADALAAADAEIDAHTELVEAQLLNESGEVVSGVEQGSPIGFRAVFEARSELRNPVFSVLCSSRTGTHVFGFRRPLAHGDDENVEVVPGQRIELSGTVANPLAPGKYVLSCWISREAERGEVAFQAVGLTAFVVYGTGHPLGLVEVDAEVQATTIDEDRR